MKEQYARTWIQTGGATPGDKERRFSVGVELKDVTGLTPFKDGHTVEYVKIVPVTGVEVIEAALENCRKKHHEDLAAIDADIEELSLRREELLKEEFLAAEERENG